MPRARKCLVIGLDCATPQLVFDQLGDELPVLSRLRASGISGRLASTIPPITCPAWMCMVTGKDPGRLGQYGFRNRVDYTYERLRIGTYQDIEEPALWDIVGAYGLSSLIVGVPMTYPPRPIRGHLVSCFLTPSKESDYTYPHGFRDEIDQVAPRYALDVEDFRTEDKAELLARIYEMTEQRFLLLRHIVRTKPWDLCMFVEMGVDRLYHGFWRHCARDHRLFEPGNPFESAIRDYHIYLDGLIGELLTLVDEETIVLVVSDHGAKSMVGGICVNEWLTREGYLVLKEAPTSPTRLEPSMVDWSRTRAWGEGGYYGRVMLNVAGREPGGVIPQGDYEAERDALAQRLCALGDEEGRPIGTRVFKPEDVYREVRNIPPDLIVYFGDLDWRSAGSVGTNTVHIYENDTGPDDANHAQEGLFALHDARSGERGTVEGATIYDIAPTLLQRMGLPVPPDMIGRPIHN